MKSVLTALALLLSLAAANAGSWQHPSHYAFVGLGFLEMPDKRDTKPDGIHHISVMGGWVPQQHIAYLCRGKYLPWQPLLACNIRDNHQCQIFITNSIPYQGWLYKQVLEHEKAQCYRKVKK